MEPAIYDVASPWSNLWILGTAIFAAVWALAFTCAVTAAVAMPYLMARAMARRSQSRTARNNNRAFLIATVAVIILMAGTVTGLAYGIGAAKDQHLADRPNLPSVAETDLNDR